MFIFQIKFNDDCVPNSNVMTSCITAAVVSGTSYAIQVYGYSGVSGSISLTVTAPQMSGTSNDNFAKYVVSVCRVQVDTRVVALSHACCN